MIDINTLRFEVRLNKMDNSQMSLSPLVVEDLLDRIETAEKERDALLARIEAMERQEPYSYIYEYSNPIDGSPVWRDVPGYWNAQFPKSSKPLYLTPGAKGE